MTVARHFHDNCAYCGAPFSDKTIAGVQNITANHEMFCPDNPDNTIGDTGPSVEEALEAARKELGDW
jgi:hypothetical protein